MKIYDVSLAQAKTIAATIGVEFVGNETITKREKLYRTEGRLVPRNGYNPYQRTSGSYFNPDRKVHAICWHGYRDFIREIFRCYPNARITTGLYGKTDYKGRQDFEDNYRETGLIKIGAPIADGYPRLCEACTCPDSGRNN